MGTSGEIRQREPAETRSSTKASRGGARYFRRWLQETLWSTVRRGRALSPAEQERLARREDLAADRSRPAEASSTVTGYAVYGEFIKDELEGQDKRKASFEQRGLAVITTSGTLVTLLFALAALSTREATTFTLPTAARTSLSVALVLFFVSALAALLSNAPLIYQAVPANKIRERLREKAPRNADAAAKDVAFSRLDALDSAKKQNDIKGRALTAAMLSEALAVGCVAVAILIIL